MNRKNSSAAMIAVICTVLVIAFSVAVIMFATRRPADSDEETLNGGSLPEMYVGSWELPADSHVLQSPRNADVTEDDALADEYDFGVMITYGEYSTNRVGRVSSPTYRLLKDCGTKAMDKQGMQSDGIMDEFTDGATVSMIEVYNADGSELCDTVFIIDDEYLIYYGTGNYVFCAVKQDAVG